MPREVLRRLWRTRSPHASNDFSDGSGTTGFCGGEREEGGRAYVRIRAKNADFFAKVNTDDKGRPQEAEIAVSGDAEILALMESLHFAFLALMETCADEND